MPGFDRRPSRRGNKDRMNQGDQQSQSNHPERVFDHVLIIMFENEYRSYVMQNPYMRGLARQGIDMVNYFGVMHPSQTNYISSIAGELCNVTDDEPPRPLLEQRTIVDLVEESPYGLRWRAYMDSYIPQNQPWSPTLEPKDEYPYVIKHNPFSSFENIVRNEARWKRIANESVFWQDLINGDFPEYAWFTPDMWHDGHYLNGKHPNEPGNVPPERAPRLVDQLARWLESFFTALRFPGPDSHLPPRTLVVVTFDEADYEADYDPPSVKKYFYDGPNQIYTVLLGDIVLPGVEEEGYNHYSLIKTIETNFGLDTLGKNDHEANHFQFLWNRRFAWSVPMATPITTPGNVAATAFRDALFVAYPDEKGQLLYRTYHDGDWHAPQPVGPEGIPIEVSPEAAPALAATDGELLLVYRSPDDTLRCLNYSEPGGWSDPEPIAPIAATPAGSFALASFTDYYEQAERLMLAFQTKQGTIESLVYDGSWADAVTVPGARTDGAVALSVLGPSLYLIHKVENANTMNVVSYNTAEFNVVTLSSGKYSGPYDDTTRGLWSPSAYPVAHFSHGPFKRTDEDEPVLQPYRGAGPLATATLDGVIHLAHPGVGHAQVFTETFSLSGIMTPKLPISYAEKASTTTNDGYGTLAQAGWSKQTPIRGVFAVSEPVSVLSMARLGVELLLLFRSAAGAPIQLCRGGYNR